MQLCLGVIFSFAAVEPLSIFAEGLQLIGPILTTFFISLLPQTNHFFDGLHSTWGIILTCYSHQTCTRNCKGGSMTHITCMTKYKGDSVTHFTCRTNYKGGSVTHFTCRTKYKGSSVAHFTCRTNYKGGSVTHFTCMTLQGW